MGEEYYCKFFQNAMDQRFIAEGTTDYSNVIDYPEVPRRMAHMASGARIILAVRHPVERAISHWRLMRSVGITDLGFYQAMIEHPPIVNSSKYYSTLRSYLRYFEKDQMLVVFFEEFCEDQNAELKRIFDFLGLGAKGGLASVRSENRTGEQMSVMLPAVRRVRSFPFVRGLWNRVPLRARNRFSKALRSRVDLPVDIDVGCRDFLRRELAQDMEQFLEIAGNGSVRWQI